MNPAEKMALKAQLSTIGTVFQTTGTQAQTGTSMPISTAMGPAAAPGLIQLGIAVNMQSQALQDLIRQINKIVDSL